MIYDCISNEGGSMSLDNVLTDMALGCLSYVDSSNEHEVLEPFLIMLQPLHQDVVVLKVRQHLWQVDCDRS